MSILNIYYIFCVAVLHLPRADSPYEYIYTSHNILIYILHYKLNSIINYNQYHNMYIILCT